MKRLLFCLFALCLAVPSWGDAGLAEMGDLKKFVQQLEKARDLPREKQETLLGIKFKDTQSGVAFSSGRFVYGKGLIVGEVNLRFAFDTNEMYYLKFFLGDESSCFTMNQIEQLYPEGEYGIADVGELPPYCTKNKKGSLWFKFYANDKNYCLGSIMIFKGRAFFGGRD